MENNVVKNKEKILFPTNDYYGIGQDSMQIL